MNEDENDDVELTTYDKLRRAPLKNDIDKKNNFNYISWASANHHLLSIFPEATWEHKTWGDIPFLKTSAGCFVQVSVTIDGITRSQLHPVLDHKNQTIKEPNAFQINTSIQRAFVKACALHGLGLWIYAGEDLPPSEKEAIASSRMELTQLLKEHNKLTSAAAASLLKLTYDELRIKIDEYRGKA